MQRAELERLRYDYVHKHVSYKMVHHSKFNYKILSNIMYSKRPGRGKNDSWNDAVIMADTETSKKYRRKEWHNHVVAWTISIRAYDMNIVTLYGHRPDTMIETFETLRDHLNGDRFIIYFHNLPYDYTFLRKFLYEKFGHPVQQLNIKSHYPLFMNFENGLQIRDSLMLAQRKLETWAKDLQVEHLKSVGLWDYDRIRTQKEKFTPEELEYIEHDTLAGVECLDKTLKALGKKHIYSMPYTATGIVREEAFKRGTAAGAKAIFDKLSLSYDQYKKMEHVFHGGYVHANRHLIDETIEGLIECFDFASSYPYCLLARKYPMEKFTPIKDCKLSDIVDSKETTAFMFKLILIKPRLKTDFTPMPVLQKSKCIKTINEIEDNGRILGADYVEIYVNEMDGALIQEQYKYDGDICVEVEAAYKDYLPRWFTDYVYELFASKCKLKKTSKEDPVSYALAKARLNSMYGLCVQKSIKELINEDYITGDFKPAEGQDDKKIYDKYLKKKSSILLFSWGTWCTSYAMYNLFQLGKFVDNKDDKISHWIYSDTDSCYSDSWDYDKVKAYNESAKEALRANNYGPVVVDGKEYWLGVAEYDDAYTQYRTEGAKRYCGRNKADRKLHITVAGVPKEGAECLEDDINNFTQDFVFPGSKTGKLTHTYFMIDSVYTDRWGNITGDSINLTPCDYRLDKTHLDIDDWWTLFDEEVVMQIYE